MSLINTTSTDDSIVAVANNTHQSTINGATLIVDLNQLSGGGLLERSNLIHMYYENDQVGTLVETYDADPGGHPVDESYDSSTFGWESSPTLKRSKSMQIDEDSYESAAAEGGESFLTLKRSNSLKDPFDLSGFTAGGWNNNQCMKEFNFFEDDLSILNRSTSLECQFVAVEEIIPIESMVTIEIVTEEGVTSFQQSAIIGKKFFEIDIACATDIGGSRENQDTYFVVKAADLGIFIICVLDGHGWNGKKIAFSCRDAMIQYIKTEFNDLKNDPVTFLENLFDIGHASTDLSQGGSTCTIEMIVGNTKYVANCGDSEVLTCCNYPVLNSSIVTETKDTATSETYPGDKTLHIDTSTKEYLLTDDHSGNSSSEYYRMHKNGAQFKYNDRLKPVSEWDSVFTMDSNNNVVKHELDSTNYHGKCYTTVRKDWGVYIINPHDNGQLAMTRSLVDTNYHRIGVTHKPVIKTVQVMPTISGDQQVIICDVIATDGVWDGWEYSHMTEFVLHETCLNVLTKNQGIQDIANSLKERNMIYGKRHFGTSRDNATLVLVYIRHIE